MRTVGRWRTVAVVTLSLAALLALLYVKTRNAGESSYFENMALLRHLQQLDTQWDAEVLRSKIGINTNYDPLVDLFEELSDVLRQLDAALAEQYADAARLPAVNRALHEAIEAKTRLIEHFKSHNAVLRNSLTFLPIAADDIRLALMRRGSEQLQRRDIGRQVNDVLLATLVYSQSSFDSKIVEIDQGLANLQAAQKQLPAEVGVRLVIFDAHVRAVLREYAAVNDLLKRIAAVPTTARTEEISALLDSEWQTASMQAQQHRHYLLAFCGLLVVLLMYAVLRSVRNHGIINQVNQQLQEANEALGSSFAMLHATLESTADAVLAIQGKTICYNTQYRELWNTPAELLEGEDAGERLRWNAAQATDPDAYMALVRESAAHPDKESFQVIEMKDGRFIERYLKPQRIDGKTVGVVINFRDITRRKRDEAELAKVHQQLCQSSRRAGMAEVATGVLHNVGNVLNSVNVSANLIAESTKKSKVASLIKVVSLLREQQDKLGEFVDKDPRGRHLPSFLEQLAERLLAEQQVILQELNSLCSSIDHIKKIVAMQQDYAKVSGMAESFNVIDLIEDTLRMSNTALLQHGVTVIREFAAVPHINTDKHKILQILMNLVSNAKCACSESGHADKRITIRVGQEQGVIKIAVIDNGTGIAAENLTRIFGHGFTTRRDGHGFGLHSGALAAHELGGALCAYSDGPGLGATFVLELPLQYRELAYGT